jgi:hypothetical protein
MLTGRCAAVDDVMMAVVRFLEREPTPVAVVPRTLLGQGLHASEETVASRTLMAPPCLSLAGADLDVGAAVVPLGGWPRDPKGPDGGGPIPS